MANLSDQWQKLTRDEFAAVDDAFLEGFRAPGAANKFVAWDPLEKSSRYFKFLLLHAAQRRSPAFFDAYERIENRDLGAPITVRCGGCDVDADYFAAVEEWEFLEENGGLRDVRRVVEIGAGFGRTCHTLLTLCPQIEEYVIVDLAPMLRLSGGYLRRVMPRAPVRFVTNEDADAIASLQPDLVINIDSFQEMPPDVIDSYMTRIVKRASRFYCKNPIGKYLPASIGRPDLTAADLMDVFKLGRCQDVIDIFDDDALAAARERFVAAYRPSADAGERAFRLVASQPMDLFAYFVHALYSR